jgi:drug/metabolite transporter (DMT)-like permease
LTFLGIVLGYLSDYITFKYQMSGMELLGAAIIVGGSCTVFALKIIKYSD